MATEIERKFRVVGGEWRALARGVPCRQGYLSSTKERVVRVRTAGSEATLTIKGLTTGLSRVEFEYPIPTADANRMLDELCERPLVEKIRYEQRSVPMWLPLALALLGGGYLIVLPPRQTAARA